MENLKQKLKHRTAELIAYLIVALILIYIL